MTQLSVDQNELPVWIINCLQSRESRGCLESWLFAAGCRGCLYHKRDLMNEPSETDACWKVKADSSFAVATFKTYEWMFFLRWSPCSSACCGRCLKGRRHEQCLGVSVKMPACVLKMPMGGVVCVSVYLCTGMCVCVWFFFFAAENKNLKCVTCSVQLSAAGLHTNTA